MIDNISSFKPVSLTEFTMDNSSAIYKSGNTESIEEFKLDLDATTKSADTFTLSKQNPFIQKPGSSSELGSFFDGYG